jgi:hypothetical protein
VAGLSRGSWLVERLRFWGVKERYYKHINSKIMRLGTVHKPVKAAPRGCRSSLQRDAFKPHPMSH